MAKHGHEEHIKDRSVLWDQYVKEADAFDQDVIQGLSGDLDALLIFAGLFSAINTAFIIESYQDLRPDPADATILLLRKIAYNLDNSTVNLKDLYPVDFVVPSTAVIVNSLYFASLSCSLFAAFGAVLAKQWLNEYRKTGKKNRSSYDRAHRRHIKYLGMEKYQNELVVQVLGTILQISLFLFLAGVVEWLWPINQVVASVVTTGAILLFLFYVITTITSIFDHSSPFSAHISVAFRRFWPSLQVSEIFTSFQDGQCMAWLLDNATTFESISAVANSVALLPQEDRAQHDLNIHDIGPLVLRSIISDDAIATGYFDGSLHSTLRTLSAVLLECSDSPHFPFVMEELGSVLRFVVTRDEAHSTSIVRLLELASRSDRQVYGSRRDVVTSYLAIPTLSCVNMQAGLSLLYRHFIQSASVKELREELRSEINKGTSIQKTWQWRVAEALEQTRRLDDKSVDGDSLRFEFRQKWALIFLETSPRFGVRPCPLWTTAYVADSLSGSVRPRVSYPGTNLDSGTGLLVLLQYAWDRREGRSLPNESVGLAPDLDLLCTVTSTTSIDILTLAFKITSDLHEDHELALMPLLWLGYHHESYKKYFKGRGCCYEPGVMTRYAEKLWWVLLNRWGSAWMTPGNIIPYLQGIEAFVAEVTLIPSGPGDLSSYYEGYMRILQGSQTAGFADLGDYEITKRFECCVDALARGFGVDVDRIKEAYLSNEDVDVDGMTLAWRKGTSRRKMSDATNDTDSEDTTFNPLWPAELLAK